MKRAISFLLTLLMLLSMLTGLSTVAFAEEAESAALEIYTQTGEAEPELVKSYKLSELDALKETAKDGYTYVYWKGEDQKQVVATELVSLDALLSDAGTTFGAGDELKFTCSDGPYPKGDFSYESMAERGYDTENNAVPSAFALTYGNTLEAQENTGKLRFVCGATAAELEAKSAAGNRMPSDVIAVTIVKPEPAETPALEVYTKTGDAEPELVKSYAASELAELKETTETGYCYVYWKGDDMKTIVATEYVTLDALLSDAGTTFGAGDELKFTCSDGPYPKGDFSYESMAERGYDTENNAVPSAFALTYGNTLEAQENTGKLRFVCGATAAELEAKSAAGNRMPSDVIAVTIVKAEEPPKPVAVFDDVAKDAYYYDAVYWAVGKEITKGTSEKTFSPYKDCTRAEMVTFLWRAAGSPAYVIVGDPLMVIPFQDVKSTDYFCQAVLWAVHNGITKGTSVTTFSPDKTVSRAEAVTFLFRMAKAEKPEKAASFTDVPADAYYADAVAWACAKEITLGTSATTFSPNNPCLRAQIVTFLYRYFNAK